MPLVRLLLIVSRQNRESYGYAQRLFGEEPRVEIILDRRYGERRRWQDQYFQERRNGDRRHLRAQESPRGLSWAIAARPADLVLD